MKAEVLKSRKTFRCFLRDSLDVKYHSKLDFDRYFKAFSVKYIIEIAKSFELSLLWSIINMDLTKKGKEG